MFTQRQIEEIRSRLSSITVRDTDFVSSNDVVGDELIVMVQSGRNVKITLRDFLLSIGYVEDVQDFSHSIEMIMNGANFDRLTDEEITGLLNL